MRRFDDFCRALKNLQEIRGKLPPYDTITQTGMVSLFEICFEQAWKAMKEALELAGFSKERTGSPRMVIKQAYQAGMIADEELWLAALVARNNVAHTYNEAIALGIIREAQERYLPMLETLKAELEKGWELA